MTALADPGIEQSQRTTSSARGDEEEEESSNKIFNVKEAVPPTDYNAPYS
jgi:hypothetical protein|tara:strand:+ start:140 stop:289 length:150 start_codon:yes stop_codon:yes gene_type:complete